MIPTLAIGPANYAGQAYAWAEAVNQGLEARAWSFTGLDLRQSGFQFETHRRISGLRFRNPIARGFRSKLFFRGATHIALDGFTTYFRAKRRGKFRGDARWLARQGWQVALVSHGSDTRSPELHMDRLEWSYFRDGDAQWREALSTTASENRRTAEESGLPVFFSTPDLALDLPMGTWLPVCVDVDGWACDAPVLERRVPRVVHMPSNSVVKGTKYVVEVMSGLADEGLIEYVSPGKLPHAEMRALIHSADVVVDQVLSGFYGVAAVEAMASGRVLIGSLADDVAALMPEAPSFLTADPSSLREVMLSVLETRDEQREAVQRNLAFVRRWHDGRAAAAALSGFLGTEAPGD